MGKLKIGKYKHFKGKIYELIGTAVHTETSEELIIYHDKNSLWARPKSMFLEEVDFNGKKVPRFKYIKE